MYDFFCFCGVVWLASGLVLQIPIFGMNYLDGSKSLHTTSKYMVLGMLWPLVILYLFATGAVAILKEGLEDDLC